MTLMDMLVFISCALLTCINGYALRQLMIEERRMKALRARQEAIYRQMEQVNRRWTH